MFLRLTRDSKVFCELCRMLCTFTNSKITSFVTNPLYLLINQKHIISYIRLYMESSVTAILRELTLSLHFFLRSWYLISNCAIDRENKKWPWVLINERKLLRFSDKMGVEQGKVYFGSRLFLVSRKTQYTIPAN